VLRSILPLLAACAVALVVAGCAGGASGGDESVTVNDRDPPFDEQAPAMLLVDGDSGSDDWSRQQVAEAEGAFRTIQRALDEAEPGDTVRVRGASLAYAGGLPATGPDPGGIRVQAGGLPGRILTIEGVPGADGRLPVIDQGRTAADAVAPMAGLVLACVSHVTIRNLQIANVNDAGITTSLSGCSHAGLVIERNLIAGVRGTGFVSGIRLVRVSQSVVRSNRVSDVTRAAVAAGINPLRGSNTPDLSGNLIEHNEISGVEVGVHLHVHGDAGVADQTIRGNVLRDLDTGLLLSTLGRNGRIDRTEFSENAVVDAHRPGDEGKAVEVLLGTGTQSDGLQILSNTFHAVDQPVSLSGIRSVEIVDNVMAGFRRAALTTVVPANEAVTNQLLMVNNNLYGTDGGVTWVLGLGSSGELSFDSLGGWQQALTLHQHPDLASNPDSASILADPGFVDAQAGDLHLRNDSPGQGLSRSGDVVGAFGPERRPGPSW